MQVREECFSAVGHHARHGTFEGTAQKVPDARTGIHTSGDKVAPFKVERIEAVCLMRIHKGMDHGAHALDILHIREAPRSLAQRVGAKFILRGLRSVKDFEYERDIANMNHRLSGIETVLLFTEPHYSSVSSSVVRELIAFGKDVSDFLPKKS